MLTKINESTELHLKHVYLHLHLFLIQMKAKVQAKGAPAERNEVPQSESESDAADHRPSSAASKHDVDTSLAFRSRPTDDTEVTRSNIVALQKKLLSKFSSAEKSPMQRQKDTFADFIKEVTYTFPPSVWLSFQTEVNGLLQKYQYELRQVPPLQTQQPSMQNQQQQHESFHKTYTPASFVVHPQP